MDDFYRYNGRVVSAKSAIQSIEGVPYFGITAVDFSDKLDIKTVKGNQRDGAPIGATSGSYSCDSFTMTMLYDVFVMKFQPQFLALNLTALAPGSLSDFEFTYTCQMVEETMGFVSTDVVSNCRVAGVKRGVSEDSNEAVVELTMGGRMIVSWNGMSLYNPARSLL